MGYGEIGITLVFGTSFEGSSPSTPAMAIWWNWYTQQTQNLPDIMSLSVRVRLSLPFTTGEKMRNVVMLATALMMGCGDKEEDSASDTAAAEDTAVE